GITQQMIDDALYDAFGQRQVSTIFTQLNQYHVVMEVEPRFRDEPKDLSQVYIRPPNNSTGVAGSAGGATGAGGSGASAAVTFSGITVNSPNSGAAGPASVIPL